jgi:3-oxoacyl-(acyl-carrier-protein) synthase
MERQSLLLGKADELLEEIRAFGFEVAKQHQEKLLDEIGRVTELGRQVEEKLTALRNERGGMNDPLRLCGERLQHMRVAYESAMAATPQSAFPTEEEKLQIRRHAERARVAYVEAEAGWHRRDAEARKLDAGIEKAQAEYRALRERSTKLNCALTGTPYADRSGLAAVPDV